MGLGVRMCGSYVEDGEDWDKGLEASKPDLLLLETMISDEVSLN